MPGQAVDFAVRRGRRKCFSRGGLGAGAGEGEGGGRSVIVKVVQLEFNMKCNKKVELRGNLKMERKSS